ncbi:MAG: iron-sulfur cluster repair di-iron protein [Bacillota bacterium]
MNNQKIDRNTSVGEIVAAFPQSSDFFKKYKIDFCCGGTRSLKQAIAERKLQEEEVIAEMEQFYLAHSRSDDNKDWREVHSEELINHIISEHHHFTASEVKQMTPYVNKVALVHGESHPHLKEVLSLFNDLKIEIEEHFEKEEKFVFPEIIKHENNMSEQSLQDLTPIFKDLVEDPDQAGDILKQIRKVTNDYQLPERACGTYRLVYNRLEMLEDDMLQHIHLENNILFPRYIS